MALQTLNARWGLGTKLAVNDGATWRVRWTFRSRNDLTHTASGTERERGLVASVWLTVLCFNRPASAGLRAKDVSEPSMKPHHAVATMGLASLLCSSAQAANWQSIGAPVFSGRAGQLQVDQSSIIRRGPVVSVWTRAIYRQDFEVPGSNLLRSRVVVSLTDFDCRERTETTRRIVFLSDDESQLPLGEHGPFAMTEVIPGSAKEATFEFVCQRGK
jgi:hypothetical protein